MYSHINCHSFNIAFLLATCNDSSGSTIALRNIQGITSAGKKKHIGIINQNPQHTTMQTHTGSHTVEKSTHVLGSIFRPFDDAVEETVTISAFSGGRYDVLKALPCHDTTIKSLFRNELNVQSNVFGARISNLIPVKLMSGLCLFCMWTSL